MGPDSVGDRLARLRTGIAFNAKMNVRLGTKAPAHIFFMGSGETTLYYNRSYSRSVLKDPSTPFAIVLNSKENFHTFSEVMKNVIQAYVFCPQSKTFVFSPWDFNMAHDTLSCSLLVNLARIEDMRSGLLASGTRRPLTILKGSFKFNAEGNVARFSTVILDCVGESGIYEDIFVKQSYYQLAISLKEMGCRDDMTIDDYVPRAGMAKYSGYLKKSEIYTLRDMLNNFGKEC